MATIEEKIQSVKSNDAATNPYVQYATKMSEIIVGLEGIGLINNGNPNDGGLPPAYSTYQKIENQWNGWTYIDPISGLPTIYSGWVNDIANIQYAINSSVGNMNSHYNGFWANSNTMNYKNRPSMLDGIHQVRINVAIEDAGGYSLTDEEKEMIAGQQHNDLVCGTATFNAGAVETVNQLVDEAMILVNAYGDNIIAVVEQDMIDAREGLSPIIALISEINTLFSTWSQAEEDQHTDSIKYATAYGAVIFALKNPDDIVVKSLMGNLP